MNEDVQRFFARSTHCDAQVTRRIVVDIDTITRTLRLTRRITTWGTTEQPKICLYGGLPLNFSGSRDDDNGRVRTDTDSTRSISEGTCVIPIQIWLTHQYPIEPPTVYIVCNPLPDFEAQSLPRRAPSVKIMSNHPYVDITGLCFCRELAGWVPAKSSLCELIERFGRALESCGVCPIYIDSGEEPAGGAGENAQKQQKNDSSADECIVCYARRDTVLVPCGHYCLCVGCAANVLECPMCRTKIKVRQRIFR